MLLHLLLTSLKVSVMMTSSLIFKQHFWNYLVSSTVDALLWRKTAWLRLLLLLKLLNRSSTLTLLNALQSCSMCLQLTPPKNTSNSEDRLLSALHWLPIPSIKQYSYLTCKKLPRLLLIFKTQLWILLILKKDMFYLAGRDSASITVLSLLSIFRILSQVFSP